MWAESYVQSVVMVNKLITISEAVTSEWNVVEISLADGNFDRPAADFVEWYLCDV